jgi:hypothetical protein
MDRLLSILFGWLLLTVLILRGLYLGGFYLITFLKVYWLVLVAVIVACFFFYPDQMKFWEEWEKEEPTPQIVENHIYDIPCPHMWKESRIDNKVIRIELCYKPEGEEYTLFLNGNKAEVQMFKDGTYTTTFRDEKVIENFVSGHKRTLHEHMHRDDI